MRPKNPMTITRLFYSLGEIFEEKKPNESFIIILFFYKVLRRCAKRGRGAWRTTNGSADVFSRTWRVCVHRFVRTRAKSVLLLLLILRSGRPRTTTGYTGAKRRRRINRTRFRRRSRQAVCVMTPNNGRKQSKNRGTGGRSKKTRLKNRRKIFENYYSITFRYGRVFLNIHIKTLTFKKKKQ